MLFTKGNIVGLFLTELYLSLFTGLVHAQDTKKESDKFHIGITSSISASTLKVLTQPLPAGTIGPEPNYHRIPKMGYKAGATVKFNLAPHYFLVSGLLFVKNKTEISTDFQLGVSDEKLTIDENYSWIEMPVNANYIFNPESSKKIFLGLGLSARRLLNAKATISATIDDVTYSGSELSTNDFINNWNIFGISHAGVELPVSDKSRFLITISFERNLSKMLHEIDNSNSLFNYGFVHSDFKINSFSLNASYLF